MALDDMEVMWYGVLKMVFPGEEEEELQPPPTFPLVPPRYATMRSWGNMQDFQYQLHLETLQSTEELRCYFMGMFPPPPPPSTND